MATSGTIGRTQFDITNFIETAVRRSGKITGTISAEQQQIAINALFLLMSHLANRGLSLWCVKKYIVPVVGYQSVYTLPVGVIDLLKTLYRKSTLLTPANTTVAPASITLDFGAAPIYPINNVSLLGCGADLTEVVVSESSDGATWSVVQYLERFIANGTTYSFDLTKTATLQYLRVQMNGSALLSFTGLEARSNPTEYPIVKFNRDNFADLPNKYQTAPAGPQLQLWFDKQRDQPQITPWPLITTSGDQIVCYTQRQMQDPGDLTDQLDVPQRWYQYVAYQLAHDVALEIPGVAPERITYLDGKAQQTYREAEDGETDGSPIRIRPDISGYTR